MSIEVKALAFALGAQVRGVDPTRALSPGTVREVRTAWLKHQVLVFPEMRMSVDQHIAFLAFFLLMVLWAALTIAKINLVLS